MRRPWLAVSFALGACFDPTQHDPNPSGGESGSGDPTSTGGSATLTASSTGSPTSASDTTTMDQSSEATTATVTTVADESTTGAESTDSTGRATGSESSTGDPPPADYGPCGSCAPGELEAALTGVDGCYCAPACEDMMCPAAPEGTAMAQCAVGGKMGTMYCALICDPMMAGQCPMEMECVDVPMMPGVGVCTFPA